MFMCDLFDKTNFYEISKVIADEMNDLLHLHRQISGIFHYNESTQLHKIINKSNRSKHTEQTDEENTKAKRQQYIQNIFIYNYLQCLQGKCDINQQS